MPSERVEKAIAAVKRGDHEALRALKLTRTELIELRASVAWGYATTPRMEGVVTELIAEARDAEATSVAERAIRLARWAIWIAIVSTLVTAVGVWRAWGAALP